MEAQELNNMGKGELKRRTDDPQANPLLSPRASGMLDRSINLYVCFPNILIYLFALLVDLFKSRILLDDGLIYVLEQLGEFDHLAFDFLNGFMATLDGAEGGLGLATAVALKKLVIGDEGLAGWIMRRKEVKADIQLVRKPGYCWYPRRLP